MSPTNPVRILAVQHEGDAGPGWIGERLRELGAELRILHPYLGDPVPGTTDGFDGLLVMGGTPGPFDDVMAPWLPDVRRLMAAALEDQRPLLGICLGGELLAAVAGGKVDRVQGPPEIGLHRVTPTDAGRTDPLFAGVPDDAPAVEWHYEEIVELPPGAVAVCAHDRFPNQAFRVGPVAWGTQFHPETLAGSVGEWAQAEAAGLARYGLSPDGVRAEVAAQESELRRVWGALAARWLEVVAAAV